MKICSLGNSHKGYLMNLENICLKAHLFVCTSCTYTLPDKNTSLPEEAVILRKNLKERAKLEFGPQNVRVSAVKCLGECKKGIAAVCYPSGQWITGIRASDEEIIYQKLKSEVGV
jgi:predicted metal-binding protein